MRLPARAHGGHAAAVRLHHEQGGLDAASAERLARAVQVVLDERAERGVDGRRGCPRVLAELSGDLRREGDRPVGEGGAERGPDTALVLVVEIAEQEGDRDRLGVVRSQALHEFRDLGVVEGGDHPPGRVDSLRHLIAELPRDEFARPPGREAVDLRTIGLAIAEHVAEAAGRDERRPAQVPRERGVGGHRGAVAHQRDVGELHSEILQRGDGVAETLRRVQGRRRDLGLEDVTARAARDGIGEGATGIDADGPKGGGHRRLRNLGAPNDGSSRRRCVLVRPFCASLVVATCVIRRMRSRDSARHRRSFDRCRRSERGAEWRHRAGASRESRIRGSSADTWRGAAR